MKRLGPELRMPKFSRSSMKAPPVVTDLYQDLRDRRLLPLIALVVVAIVAVPFLLGSDSEEAVPSPQSMGLLEELKAEAADPASLTVVEAKPGLRDYRRRLRGRTPTDPFLQRYTASMLKGSELPEPKKTATDDGEGEATKTTTATDGSAADGGSDPSPVVTSPPAESSPGGAGSAPKDGEDQGDGDAGGDQGITLYSFAVDVRIVKTTGEGGTKETDDPIIKHRVLPTTPLPGPKAQVVTYMGISPKTKKPTFLVSTEVTAMFGEGKCAAGTEVCQLVELEPGFPQTFVYGDGGARYKLQVLDVEAVENGRLDG